MRKSMSCRIYIYIRKSVLERERWSKFHHTPTRARLFNLELLMNGRKIECPRTFEVAIATAKDGK